MGKLTLSTLWKKSILLSLYFHLCSIVARRIDLGNIFLQFRLLQLITDDHFLVSLEFIQLTIHWALKRRGFSEAASALLCKIDVKILVLFVLTKEISSTYSVVKLILPFFFMASCGTGFLVEWLMPHTVSVQTVFGQCSHLCTVSVWQSGSLKIPSNWAFIFK